MVIPGQGVPGMGNLVAVPAAPGLLDHERLDLEEPREKKKRRQEEGKVHSKTVASSGSLLGQPIFHTFKTDVGDMDLYRQGVKDDILTWLNTLKKVEFNSDWMILVVETPENRKGNYAGHAEGRGRQDPRQVCGTDGPQQGRLQGS